MADSDILVSEMTPALQINTTDLMIMTQPDAQAETGYATKSGTVLQVANKMLKGTEYSTDLPDFTDKTPLGGLEELKADIKALLPIGSASGNPCTFETGISDTLVSLKAAIVASGGNGTPSTPIPIVGHSELNLVRCGINHWDEVASVGQIESDGSINTGVSRLVTDYIAVVPNTTYCVSIPFNNITRGAFYDKNKNLISYYSDFPKSGTPDVFPNNGQLVIYGDRLYFTFITPQDCAYVRYNFPTVYGTTYVNDVSINYPSTDKDYHAYNGQTIMLAFGQTVYGGEYTADGKVRITHVMTDMGDMYWSYNAGYGFISTSIRTTIKGVPYTEIANVKCDIFKAVKYDDVTQRREDYAIGVSPTEYGFVVIADSDYTSEYDFNQYIRGHKLVYELATPIEIDVSSISVEAVSGVNNIVSDCGGDVEVQYRDSIQHYIDSKIASVQALIL